MAEEKKDRNLRSVTIRVSAKNKIHADNEKLGLKAGDVVEYTLQDILDILDNWCKTKPFYYFVIEHNEDPENVHYHIVIEFRGKSQCKFSTVKNKFPFGYIDNCRSGIHHCVRYLIHADHPAKHQYSWDNVVTNSPGKLEMYKQPSKYSEQVEVDRIVDLIIKCKIKKYEITDKINPLLYVKYHSVFKNAYELRNLMLLKNPTRNITTYVLQGPSRTGKSTLCRLWAEKHNKTIRFSSASNDIWQDYSDEDVFVLDDFDYNTKSINDVMGMIDPHVQRTNPKRYKNSLFIGDTIMICTNMPILTWYDDENKKVDSSSREALFKRISLVLDFQDYKMKPRLRNYDVTYVLDKKTGEYQYMPFGENKNEELLQKGISSYTINRIVNLNKMEDRDKANELMFTQVFDHDTMYTLVSIDDKVHHLDLNKYIDTNADETNVEEFIKQLGDM